MKIFFRFEKVSTAGDLDKKLERVLGRMERKLSSFREEFRKIWIRVKKERGQYEVEGRMELPGKQVVVKERGDRLLGAVSKVREGLLRQIEKYKKR